MKRNGLRLATVMLAILLAAFAAVAQDDLIEQAKTAAGEGDFDAAIEFCTKAIASKPADGEAYYMRADIYHRQKKYALAIKDYTKVIELNPKFPGGYMNRANVYDDAGRYAEAMADYAKCIALEPANPENYYNRGLSYSRQKKYDLAIKDLTRYILTMKGNNQYLADGYNVRAVTYMRKGLNALALKDSNSAIKLAPNAPAYYRVRAEVYRLMGKKALAAADDKKAMELDEQ